MKLTEEQANIVEENHNLIYWIANESHLPLDEWYDLLAIELCITVTKHNPSKGSLSNFYKLRCRNMIQNKFKSIKAKKRLVELVEYSDEFTTPYIQDDLCEVMDLENMLESKNGKILKLRAEGYSQTEIAKMLGVNQSYISTTISKFKEKFNGANG